MIANTPNTIIDEFNEIKDNLPFKVDKLKKSYSNSKTYFENESTPSNTRLDATQLISSNCSSGEKFIKELIKGLNILHVKYAPYGN